MVRWELDAVSGSVVVVDVIRAFTTAAYAFAAGAEAIYLVAGVHEALEFKRSNPGTVVVGEDHGRRPEGFDVGNSPVAVSRLDLSGRTVVQRTSAGTQGVVQSMPLADRLWAASLVSASATAAAVNAAELGDPYYVITGCFPDAPDTSGGDDRLTAATIERIRLGGDPLPIETAAALLATNEARRTLALGPPHSDPLDVEYAARVDAFDFAMEVTSDDRGLRLEQRAP